MNVEADYRDILRDKLSERCQRNGHYSLRAFARDLEISPQRLSHVLSGRHGVSLKAAEDMAQKLGLNEQEGQIFCLMVQKKHARSKLIKQEAAEKFEQIKSNYKELSIDHFKIIADWYHFAIMELTLVKDFESKPKWISKALGITEQEVKMAIARLLKLDLLQVDKKGNIKLTGQFLANAKGVPSQALRNFHRQLMAKAADSLEFQPLEEREITSTVLAINTKNIPEAKKDLEKFRQSFDKKYSASLNKDQVYCLGIQFFNLQQKNPGVNHEKAI